LAITRFHAHILDVEGGQYGVVEYRSDTHHDGIHLFQFQFPEGLGIGGVGNHRPAHLIPDLLHLPGIDVDTEHLMAFLGQAGGQIKTEISESDNGKLFFHFLIRS
jgi:hypothetical protein